MVEQMKGFLKMLKERKNQELVCNECGRSLGRESVYEFEGNIYCEDCLDELTVFCDCCERRIWRDNAEGDSYTTLCDSCYNYNYTHCEDCGRLIHNDDAYYEDDSDYPYCHDCFERIQTQSIKSYGYKPEPIFHGCGTIFYGIELEIDKGGEDNKNAKILLDYVNQDNEYIYAKHDGSLSNGFELVSHPMTLEYHLNKVDWEGLFKKAISMGYRSHQTETCGYHIHVGRKAFGETYEEQEEVIARIVFFVESHWNELLKVSRRSTYSMERWSSRYGLSENTKETYQKAKSKRLGRYCAVNIETYQPTVELRLFRGTLRYQTFAATLQLVDEICNTCLNMNDEELEGLSWSSFVLGIKEDKSELIQYLKSKQLYVNEQILDEEDM